MYPIAEKLPNEIERAAFVEALALIGTDQQDEFYSFCEIGKLISGFSKSMVSLIDSANQCVVSEAGPEPFENKTWPVENSFCQHGNLRNSTNHSLRCVEASDIWKASKCHKWVDDWELLWVPNTYQ